MQQKVSLRVVGMCVHGKTIFAQAASAYEWFVHRGARKHSLGAVPYLDFRAPARRAPETDTRTGPCVDPLQAVGEYYNNVDKFKNNRK